VPGRAVIAMAVFAPPNSGAGFWPPPVFFARAGLNERCDRGRFLSRGPVIDRRSNEWDGRLRYAVSHATRFSKY